MIRILIVIVMLLMGQLAFGQQEQLYTQFMFNKLALNPAYAGNEKVTCMNLLYRDQWSGFNGAPTTQAFSLSAPLNDNKIGLGVNMVNTTIGVTQKLSLEGVYAYKFRIGEGMLSMGGSASFRRYTIDYSDDRLIAIQNIDIDPSITRERISKNLFNFGFGVYYNTGLYYIGASIPRLTQGNIDFDQNDVLSLESRHLNLMGGAAFATSARFTLKPQLMIRLTENAPLDFDLNLSGTFDEKYTLGLTYRAGGNQGGIGESIDFIFALQASPQVLVGFAYDLTLSDIRSYQNGSIELILHYCFKKVYDQEEIINPRYF